MVLDTDVFCGVSVVRDAYNFISSFIPPVALWQVFWCFVTLYLHSAKWGWGWDIGEWEANVT